MERSKEVYWRWSWDLRNSGGLCDGGWVGGKRAMGGGRPSVCDGDAAGVTAVAVARDRIEDRDWSWDWRRHCLQI